MCGARAVRFDGELMHLVARDNSTPEVDRILRDVFPMPMRPSPRTMAGRAILSRDVVQVEDALDDPDYQKDVAQAGGFRSMLAAPMLRDGHPIGAIVVNRRELGLFSPTQVQLLRTFADQAVIAIENARLFEAEQARTAELRARSAELHQSLEDQTATSEGLRVISCSPSELQPVLDAIVQTALRLCQSERAQLFRLYDGKYHLAAHQGTDPKFLSFLKENPISLDEMGSPTGKAARERRTIHLPDVLADPEFARYHVSRGAAGRSLICVPLTHENVAIGVITLTRTSVKPFTRQQIDLVKTFADQAVIAIENTRLFEAVQARTSELT